MQKELNNKEEDDLVKLFDYTLTVIDNKLLRIIYNWLELLKTMDTIVFSKLLPFEPCACRPADSDGKCGWNWIR